MDAPEWFRLQVEFCRIPLPMSELQTIAPRHGRFDLIVLLGFGMAALMGYLWLALVFPAAGTARDVWAMIVLLWVQGGIMALAWWCLRKSGGRGDNAPIVVMLAFAALFRLAMVLVGIGPVQSLPDLGRDLADDIRGRVVTYDTFLLYDNDIWRYLWDGHVGSYGLDPYRLTPHAVEAGFDNDDPHLAPLLDSALWWDVYDNVSFGTYRSVYPPLAQGLFRGLHRVAPGSVFVTKLALAGADLVTCFLLVVLLRRRGRCPSDAVLYAWNPLAIKEIAGSGHLDGVMIVLVVVMLLWLVEGRSTRAMVAFAAAVMAKLAPLALAGVVAIRTPIRHWWWALVTGAVLVAPWIKGLEAWLDGLSAFSRDWQFFPGLWALARWIGATLGVGNPTGWASAACGLLLVATIGFATVQVLMASPYGADRDQRLFIAVFVILAAIPLLNAAVMPWYLLWALPAAVLVGCWSWQILLGLSLLSYLIYVDQREETWVLVLGHGTFAVLVATELAVKLRRPRVERSPPPKRRSSAIEPG